MGNGIDYDYESDLSIDINQLELEWLLQPNLYRKYAELSAEADWKKNRAKEKLEVIKAELYKKVVGNYKTKPSDTKINSEVICKPEYRKVYKIYLKRAYEHSVLSFVVRAFDHRKKALENLVHLWAGSYFAGPKEPRDVSDFSIKDKAIDIAQAKQRKKLNIKRGD